MLAEMVEIGANHDILPTVRMSIPAWDAGPTLRSTNCQLVLCSGLARLERGLKDLPKECHPDEILEAFAGEAECLIEHAPADQVAHIHATIRCILAAAGLIPRDSEEPSDVG
jgi:hypothetical protein